MESKLKKYIGIDVGGTYLKGMICDETGKVLFEDRLDTPKENINEALAKDIAYLIENLIKSSKEEKSSFPGVGLGVPGIADSTRGIVVSAENLGLFNYPIVEKVSALVSMPVKITNDANAAAYGETKFGIGKNTKSSVLVTLGTGVGGGIIIDGKLFEGGKSAGGEIGHMVIEKDGLPCSCGRKGCLEAYASATALRNHSRLIMQQNPHSLMWKGYNLETCSARTAFDYYHDDKAAKEVVDWYIEHLGCGLTNIANIFRPEIIMLGGGVSAQGKNLTEPLQRIVDKEMISGSEYAPVKIAIASLGNRAGGLGACALFMD